MLLFRVLAGVLLLLHPAAARAQTVWDMATEYPQSAMPGVGVTTFAKHVAESSAGKLQIRPSFDASGGIRSAGMLAAIAEGRVQAGDAFAGALEAEDAIFALPSLPFLVTSIADARRLAELARPFLATALQNKGQRLLYLTPWPPSGIWSKSPLKMPSDLTASSAGSSTRYRKAAMASDRAVVGPCSARPLPGMAARARQAALHPQSTSPETAARAGQRSHPRLPARRRTRRRPEPGLPQSRRACQPIEFLPKHR